MIETSSKLKNGPAHGRVGLPLSRYRVEMVVPEDGRLLRLAFRTLETFLGEPGFTRLNKKANEERLPGEDFYSAYLRHNQTTVRARGFPVSRLPKKGPIVFVANHPTGVSDTAMIGSLIERNLRSDARFLVARRFCSLPGWDRRSIPIDVPSPTGQASEDDRRKLEESRDVARQYLADGGCLIIFPSGPTTRRNEKGEMEEGDWRHGAFSMAAKTGAKIVPVHVGAKRGPVRRILQKIHPILFHAASGMDVHYQHGKTVDVTIDDPDSPEMREALSDQETAPENVRNLVFRLPELYPGAD